MAIKITKKSAEELVRETRKENLRASPRRRQLKNVKLVFNDVVSSVDCRLHDISDGGAGIDCESTVGIPDHVVLKLHDGGIFDADVVWRTATKLGLRFRENPALVSLMGEFSRISEEVRPHLLKIIDLAHGASTGEQGKLGQPQLTAAMDQLSAQGRELLAVLGEFADEYGNEH